MWKRWGFPSAEVCTPCPGEHDAIPGSDLCAVLVSTQSLSCARSIFPNPLTVPWLSPATPALSQQRKVNNKALSCAHWSDNALGLAENQAMLVFHHVSPFLVTLHQPIQQAILLKILILCLATFYWYSFMIQACYGLDLKCPASFVCSKVRLLEDDWIMEC